MRIKFARYYRFKKNKRIFKNKVIDTSLFTSNLFLNRTYMTEWEKPNGERYIKFTKNKPYHYPGMTYLKINDFNSFSHKLLAIETCYIIG